jgi:hypothetical protein
VVNRARIFALPNHIDTMQELQTPLCTSKREPGGQPGSLGESMREEKVLPHAYTLHMKIH